MTGASREAGPDGRPAEASREPAGTWIGLVGTGIVQPAGCGLSVAALYDSAGRLGQSAQALVVERRTRAEM